MRVLVRLLPAELDGEKQRFSRMHSREGICEYAFDNGGGIGELMTELEHLQHPNGPVQVSRESDGTGLGVVVKILLPGENTPQVTQATKMIIGSVLYDWGYPSYGANPPAEVVPRGMSDA